MVDAYIVFHQRELAAGDGTRAVSVDGQRLGDGIAYAAFFQDVQEQSPVLALADGGHQEFPSQATGVVDGCQTANLVVALLHTERHLIGRDVDAGDIAIFVADKIRRADQRIKFHVNRGIATVIEKR